MIKSLLASVALLATTAAPASPATFVPAPLPPVEAQAPTVIDLVEPLADLIGSAESDNVGGYQAANAGRAMDLGTNGLKKHFGREAGRVTVGEILLEQSRGNLHAVGRYQVIGKTMQEIVDLRCVDGRDYFTEETQDQILVCLLQHKRPRIWHYLKTGDGLYRAARSVAYEWASMPYTDGRSYYLGGDRAHCTRAELVNALSAVRRNAVKSPELFE